MKVKRTLRNLLRALGLTWPYIMRHPPGHFYSPLTSDREVMSHLGRLRRQGETTIAGIAIDNTALHSRWMALLPHMRLAPFASKKVEKYRYFWDCGYFPSGDASVYFGLLSLLRPKRVIEIGSGFSSALLLDAREILSLDTDVTFIEPYPKRLNSLLRPADRGGFRLIEDNVQNVPLDEFSALEAGDILFVDSSHVLKTGSDVCFELFEILPRLNSGVYIHIHDIFDQFEYPEEWSFNQLRNWNEIYALRAFLMYNLEFEIFFFNAYFSRTFPELAKDDSLPFNRDSGGSFWLRRK